MSVSAFIIAAISSADCRVLELCKKSKMPSSHAASSTFDYQIATIRFSILSGIDEDTMISVL